MKAMAAMNSMTSRKQKGFTLVELVMVIVILGVLAAFALPRFADLSGDASKAAVSGAQGAVKSASGIAHATWLAGGGSGDVTLEGETITMVGGYPQAGGTLTDPSVEDKNGIAAAAQLTTADFTLKAYGLNATSTLTVSNGTCQFDYTESDGATAPSAPVTSAVTCP